MPVSAQTPQREYLCGEYLGKIWGNPGEIHHVCWSCESLRERSTMVIREWFSKLSVSGKPRARRVLEIPNLSLAIVDSSVCKIVLAFKRKL
jgi:hypothetical protein